MYRARELDQDHISLIEAKVEDEAMLYLGLRHALQGGVQVRVQVRSHLMSLSLSLWNSGGCYAPIHDGAVAMGDCRWSGAKNPARWESASWGVDRVPRLQGDSNAQGVVAG